MTIYRNGFEITLTQGELWKAYREQRLLNFKSECDYQLEDRGYKDVPEDEIEALVSDFEDRFDNSYAMEDAVANIWAYILDDDYPYKED